MNWISLNSMIRKWFRKKPLNVLEGGTGANTFEQACENLGAVKNTGDIIKGDLKIYDNIDLKETMRLKSNGNLVLYKESDNEDLESYAIQFKDEASGGDYYGHIDIIASAPGSENNKRSIRLTSHSKNIPASFSSKALNTLELGVDDTGTRTVYVSAPDAWRKAISAAASSHNHSASNITSGTLAIARGGTGRTTTANGAMYATSAGGAISMGTLPIAQGGTGATKKTSAFKNLAGWTLIGSIKSDAGYLNIKNKLTGYNEIMVTVGYSTTYWSSCILRVSDVTSTLRTWYTGGGCDHAWTWNAGSGFYISTTQFGAMYLYLTTSSAKNATAYLYAR